MRHEAAVGRLSAEASSVGLLSAGGSGGSTVVSAAFSPARGAGGSAVVIETDAGHIARQMDEAVVHAAGAAAGSLFVTAILSVAFVRYSVTSPLGRLADATVSLAGGRRPEGLPARLLRRRDELGTLGRMFTSMAVQVLAKRDELAAMVEEKTVSLSQANRRLTAAQERMEQDVGLARRVQHALVPTGTSTVGCLEFSSRIMPAGDLGGDFVMVSTRADGRVLAAVCDVSGKGVAAALFMACAQGAFVAAAGVHDALGEIVADMNDRLCHGNESRMFVTGAFFIGDPAAGSLEYVFAGHEPSIVLDAGGVLGKMDPSQTLALGILPEQRFPVSVCTLEPGGTAVVYTDGVTDAENLDGEAFGEARLQALVSGAFPGGAGRDVGDGDSDRSVGIPTSSRVCDLVWSAVAGFSGSVPPTDDKTILVIRRLQDV